MDQAITRSSRLLALAGVAGIIFGIVALVWPGITLIALVALFGAYAFADGVLAIVSAVRRRGTVNDSVAGSGPISSSTFGNKGPR